MAPHGRRKPLCISLSVGIAVMKDTGLVLASHLMGPLHVAANCMEHL